MVVVGAGVVVGAVVVTGGGPAVVVVVLVVAGAGVVVGPAVVVVGGWHAATHAALSPRYGPDFCTHPAGIVGVAAHPQNP
ncbi:hypothetical protein C1280_27035 [Gemmata obscuriglobus]|uniref:Uncharacterized protein n=1 Tax=Gemmata obscuriglobus TaxID=114 RepID=A0A2Z3H9J5_9BACT|nr:hypothetical protein C1280_27035 [Gemmata obscuriglobus]